MKTSVESVESSSPQGTGPLAGVTVVDLTHVLAGPYCTMVLRDLGARVIKVERPQVGDDSRYFPPFIEGDSGYFISINRGKESVAIDFNQPAGRELVLALCERADVLVENFSPGTLERKGLAPEVLQQRNPALIVARVSGYGQSGPDHDLPAYDIAVQARSGLMSLTGPEGGEPVKIGSAISDIGGGLFCAISVLAALNERHRSGKGQVLDIAMLDASVALLENSIVRHSIGGALPLPLGQRHPSVAPFDGFACLDGTLVIGAGNDGVFCRLAGALGHPEWCDDRRFACNEARSEHQAVLKEQIEAITQTEAAGHWIRAFREAGVPCSKIQTIDEVIADPQVQARSLVTRYPHAAGEFSIVGSPFGHFSRTPGEAPVRAPDLGEHTDGVLEELLSMSAETLRQLRDSGAIG
ncbi:MAG: CoA transferase [Deltaproteobacteria bacterium]|nr:CoA transferase [Deltaproteobacteria bacterium]